MEVKVLVVGLFRRVVEAVPEGVGAKRQRPERSDGTEGWCKHLVVFILFFYRTWPIGHLIRSDNIASGTEQVCGFKLKVAQM